MHFALLTLNFFSQQTSQMRQTRIITIQNKSVSFHLRRSRRAKNLLLRIGLVGEIEVVIPQRATIQQAEHFVRAHADWINRMVDLKKQQLTQTPRMNMVTGTLCPVFGDLRQLVVDINPSRQRSRFQEIGDQIRINSSQQADIWPTLLRWYHQRAHQYLNRRVKYFASLAGENYHNIVVSNARSQWGSCSRLKRRLSFNWRLALTPLAVSDYVIAHEVAHLKIANHSSSFWSLVQTLQPNYKSHRLWLRKNSQRIFTLTNNLQYARH